MLDWKLWHDWKAAALINEEINLGFIGDGCTDR